MDLTVTLICWLGCDMARLPQLQQGPGQLIFYPEMPWWDNI